MVETMVEIMNYDYVMITNEQILSITEFMMFVVVVIVFFSKQLKYLYDIFLIKLIQKLKTI